MNKNLILSLSLFVTMICSPAVSAITADDYKLKMDSVLETVDLSLIDSGILEGYGFSLISPSQLDGISTENCVNSDVVQMLYSDFALVRSVALANSTTQMNVSDLPNGTYYLNIVENGEVVDRQIVIIQH